MMKVLLIGAWRSEDTTPNYSLFEKISASLVLDMAGMLYIPLVDAHIVPLDMTESRPKREIERGHGVQIGYLGDRKMGYMLRTVELEVVSDLGHTFEMFEG